MICTDCRIRLNIDYVLTRSALHKLKMFLWKGVIHLVRMHHGGQAIDVIYNKIPDLRLINEADAIAVKIQGCKRILTSYLSYHP